MKSDCCGAELEIPLMYLHPNAPVTFECTKCKKRFFAHDPGMEPIPKLTPEQVKAIRRPDDNQFRSDIIRAKQCDPGSDWEVFASWAIRYALQDLILESEK